VGAQQVFALSASAIEQGQCVMEAICENCRYFVQLSVTPGKYIWGDCMNPSKRVLGANSNERSGVFTWADKTCSGFTPREIPDSGDDK
jgi:hypothetical protein